MIKRKILLISPNWIGDAVVALSLISLITNRDTNIKIDLLAPKHLADIFLRCPSVNQIFVTDFKHSQLELGKRIAWAKKLKKEKYNQAIILPNSFKSALIPFLARIPLRTGYRGEIRYFLLNDLRILDRSLYFQQKGFQKIAPIDSSSLAFSRGACEVSKRSLLDINEHCERTRNKAKNQNAKSILRLVDRYVALGIAKKSVLPNQFHNPHLETKAEDLGKAKKKFALNLTKPVIVICPGAEYGPAKKWPAEYFAKVAKKKIAEDYQVWILGGNKDQKDALEIQTLTENSCLDFTGKTTIAEAIDLLSLANMVITNDSGLMHIAAALDQPLAAIFGSSSPQYTPPLSNRAKILKIDLPCSPCFQRTCRFGHYRCLREITPEMVLTVVARSEATPAFAGGGGQAPQSFKMIASPFGELRTTHPARNDILSDHCFTSCSQRQK
jgi:heptosyltransferase II